MKAVVTKFESVDGAVKLAARADLKDIVAASLMLNREVEMTMPEGPAVVTELKARIEEARAALAKLMEALG